MPFARSLLPEGTVIIDEPRLPTLPEVTFAVVTRNPATRAAAAVASALQRHSPDLRTRRPAGAAGRDGGLPGTTEGAAAPRSGGLGAGPTRTVGGTSSRSGDLGAQLVLEQLARGIARQVIGDDDLAGQLVAGELVGQVVPQLLDAELRTVDGGDERDDLLAPL